MSARTYRQSLEIQRTDDDDEPTDDQPNVCPRIKTNYVSSLINAKHYEMITVNMNAYSVD